MAWFAARPFTYLGVRYLAGQHIPVTIPTDVQQSLLNYRRIAEGPDPKKSDAGNQRPDAPHNESSLEDVSKGYGWYEVNGERIHGKKAALAALEG